MIAFPCAKINLGLNVLSKRSDGFHEIRSILYPINYFSDSLEIAVSDSKESKIFEYGYHLDSNHENLVMKVVRWAIKEFSLPAMDIHLIKRIPIGSGLGGGSSDASSALKMINDEFSLNLSIEEMQKIIGKFGSDCPFFIDLKPAVVSGTGNIIKPIKLNLKGFYVKIVFPRIELSTDKTYDLIKPKHSDFDPFQLNIEEISHWKEYLKNDFEEVVFERHPQLAEIKNQFYESGAIYASMSGSGSALYGIYTSLPGKLKGNDKEFEWDFEL